MPKPSPTGCFLAVWLSGWSAGCLTFDGLIGRGAWQQARTARFAQTEGVITRSTLRSQRAAKGGLTYTLDVAYDYAVGGRRYTGTRYMYGEVLTNADFWSRVRRELEVNNPVPVYYDPADPADAVLRPGLSGMHLFMCWFLTPFNVVMIGGWVYLLRGRRPAFDPADRRHVEPTPTGWAVRLPGLGRLGVFGVALLAVTFTGIFVFAFGFGIDPPVPVMQGAFAGAFGLATLAAVRFGKPARVGIDDLARVVRLPGREAIPFADVREVAVAERRAPGSKGQPVVNYPCELRLADAAAPVRVAAYPDRASAEALAAWLRERIGQSK